MENKMFCFQCQETAGCSGCTRIGVCGKSASTAVLQDLLIYTTKGLCEITTALRQENKPISRTLNQFICENLLSDGKGYCEAGGYPGTQQHQYHENLYERERADTPPDDRTNAADSLYHIIYIML